MKKPLFALLLATALVPFAAVPSLAQTAPDGYGPPPEIMQLRATAKTNAFNALSQDHRNRVNAIIAQVNAGTLDRRSAAQQIDAILTPAESQAVLAQQKQMRDGMRQYFQTNPPQNGGERMGPPGGYGQPQQGQASGTNGEVRRRTPDAGRALLMLGANRPQRPPSGQPQQP